MKRLIIDCSTQQIRAKKLIENFDNEFSEFTKYMTKFQKYVDFKEKHPYSETHPDFEANKTPVTILDIENMQMESYFPDEECKSAHFAKKLIEQRALALKLRKEKRRQERVEQRKLQKLNKSQELIDDQQSEMSSTFPKHGRENKSQSTVRIKKQLTRNQLIENANKTTARDTSDQKTMTTHGGSTWKQRIAHTKNQSTVSAADKLRHLSNRSEQRNLQGLKGHHTAGVASSKQAFETPYGSHYNSATKIDTQSQNSQEKSQQEVSQTMSQQWVQNEDQPPSSHQGSRLIPLKNKGFQNKAYQTTKAAAKSQAELQA